MAIYRFNSDSLIDEVRVVKNSAGGLRAYLHARSDVSPEQIAAMHACFHQEGWKGIPFTEKGVSTLEVRGFKSLDDLVKILASQGIVSHKPTSITALASDKVTPRERFQNLTLKIAGFLYNIGDAAFMTYAIMGNRDATRELREVKAKQHAFNNPESFTKALAGKEEAVKGSKFEIAGGVGYALGGIVLSVFGGKDQSHHEIRHKLQKVNGYLQKEGIALPADSAAHDLTRKEPKGPLQAVSRFISRFPSETLNVIYTGVGIFLATGAFKKINALQLEKKSLQHAAAHHDITEELACVKKKLFDEIKDTGLGTVTMSSALAGLLIKEKKPIEGQPKRHGLGRAWEWIQEKPLRATGYGFMVSTLLHAWATFGKHKNGDAFVRKTVIGRGIFVGANIVAEILLTISSKGHGSGVTADNSVEKTVIASTAEVIARQNPAQQETLVNQLAGYLASPDVLGGKAETIAAELHAQLAGIRTSPWVVRVLTASHAPGESPHEPKPSTHIDAATASKDVSSHKMKQTLAGFMPATPHSVAIH